MVYNFTSFKTQIKEVEEWLKREFGSLRTGKASPAVLDIVKVESYGSLMSINQIGSVTVEDARSVRITPWDMSQAKAVEKAITTSNLGLSVTVDDKGLRVIFPELTTERRADLVKVAKAKLEEARKSVRLERDKVISDIDKKEKEGGMSEDEKFRFKAETQKIVDEANKNLETLFEKKDKEIMG
ncbi:MAG: hypothetical protein RJA61_523 [Candidatus Parcubacteria bacterium]|jgi:ribosome recycling factor